MWKSDLSKLRAALTPERPDIETRAVASVRMPVANLQESGNVRDPLEIVDAVVRALARHWGEIIPTTFDRLNLRELPARIEKMRSPEWIYDATPDFECMFAGSRLRVHRGVVQAGDGTTESHVGQRFQELISRSAALKAIRKA